MENRPATVLMVAPGRAVQGGMTELIKLLAADPAWKDHGCEWLETCDLRNRVRNLLAFFKAVVRFPLASWGREIVHIHAGSGTSFIRKSFFVIGARLSGRKVVLQLHITDALFRGISERFVSLMLHRADAVLVLSDRFAADLHRRFPRVPLYTVKNPVAAPGRGQVPSRGDAVNILFLGRLEERKKGALDLITAFASVSARYPSARLRLAGSGDVTEASRMSAALGVGDSVEFPGWLQGEKKAEALRSADIFCLPSYEEALPLALLEAMSYGLPAVCTGVGAIPEVLMDGKTGILVKPGDTAGLAAALEALVGSAELRRQFGSAAAELAHQYTSGAVWRRLSEVYEQIGSGTRASVAEEAGIAS